MSTCRNCSDWERHCKKAESALAEMRAVFDGATPTELRRLRDLETKVSGGVAVSALTTIDIVFDAPPGPEAGRFVEVEDQAGQSISAGEWVERADGNWVLRLEVVR